MKKIVILLLALLLVTGLWGCQKAQKPTEPSAPAATDPPKPTPEEVYATAVESIEEAASMKLTLTEDTLTTIDIDTYHTVTKQELHLHGLHTDAVQAKILEDTTIGEESLHTQTLYTDGTMYLSTGDSTEPYLFSGEVTAEELEYMLPVAVLLDMENYEQVTSEEVGEDYILSFTQPIQGEEWALPAGAELQDAHGTATVSVDGVLKESTYTLTCRVGAYTTVRSVTVKVEETAEAVTAPENADQYTSVAVPYAVKLYAASVLNIVQTNSFKGSMTETVTCQSVDATVSQYGAFGYYGTGEDYSAGVFQSTVSTVDGKEEDFLQSELYKDGVCNTVNNTGKDEETERSVADMQYYCQEWLLRQMFSLGYIEEISYDYVSGVAYLTVELNEDYVKNLNEYISTLLFGDPAHLSTISDSYETSMCNAVIALDGLTNMPMYLNMAYSGNQIIDYIPYGMTMEVVQTFESASPDANIWVMDEEELEQYVEPEPAQKATPLFYRVTGENGQQMWLLGTIHIGDNRTAYLPQEIYDAFEASDALAVECDTWGFDQKMEDDEELIEQMARLYYYADGTTISQHVSEEAYYFGRMLMIASGNYDASTEYSKPFLWESAISNFYLDYGRGLSSDYGVENRLKELADEQDKDILEVESVIFQTAMLSNLSQDLQNLMLESTIASTMAQAYMESEELYELWCAGDEAAIVEYLSQEVDTSELTEEELAEYEAQMVLWEEYDQAVSIDRNEGMLEVAKEYLESGDVVFYAVGLAHLLDGTNGLVEALRDAGYTVELVTFQ